MRFFPGDWVDMKVGIRAVVQSKPTCSLDCEGACHGDRQPQRADILALD